MSETDALAAPPPRAPRLDYALNVIITALMLGILGLSAWFGYAVWVQRQIELNSTPAMRAIEDLRRRTQMQPNDSALRVRLAESLAAAGLDQDAISQLQAAIKLDPKHTGAYLDLGIISMNRGENQAATGYFQKVLDLTANADFQGVNERREAALFNMGMISNTGKQYDQAIGYFNGALRIRQDASDTYFNLALSYEGLHQRDAAMKQLESALLFDPNYAQAQYELGKLYLQADDKVNAAVHLALAAKASPNVDVVQEALSSMGGEESWLQKARAGMASGDYTNAVEAVLVARALAPDDGAAAKLHAQILEKKGNLKGALSVYREALKLAPNDTEVKASVTRLSSSTKGS